MKFRETRTRLLMPNSLLINLSFSESTCFLVSMLTISAKIETILIPEKILVRNKLMKKLIVSQKNQEWQMVYTREKIKNQKKLDLIHIRSSQLHLFLIKNLLYSSINSPTSSPSKISPNCNLT